MRQHDMTQQNIIKKHGIRHVDAALACVWPDDEATLRLTAVNIFEAIIVARTCALGTYEPSDAALNELVDVTVDTTASVLGRDTRHWYTNGFAVELKRFGDAVLDQLRVEDRLSNAALTQVIDGALRTAGAKTNEANRTRVIRAMPRDHKAIPGFMLVHVVSQLKRNGALDPNDE